MPSAALHEVLARRVEAWRQAGYPAEPFSAIAEILEFAREPESSRLRFLRPPQLLALETYWYLRLVEGTPHILDLYRKLFPRNSELLPALGLTDSRIQAIAMDEGADGVLTRIREDDDFVRDFRLEALRESIRLDYPSYILALAMGAGKTILIGAIVATEFAMAIEYPSGPFVQNALVFAPGKTILESLRELLEVPYERLLPPRLHKRFAASVKLTFTRDGDKGIPVIPGSLFNVVVTNTEKIRIRKEDVRKGDLGTLFGEGREDDARAEVANLRLQAIASLPHLAVFSDEAHHTYGQSLDADLKKVRKTVDYLAATTNVLCVVNTTGTPYFQRQPLRDVVTWYGLSQGIRDGILKDLAGSIQAYDFEGEPVPYLRHVVEDFFREYGDVRLPNGAPAKLAIYFPQTDDVVELRPVIDEVLVRLRLSPALCLTNTSDSRLTTEADIEAFNRLNDPAAPHRVILLVNKGTEGWNCPSLFACALARKLRSSNNFVLQAATRCLRQVPGNRRRARVYLSTDNFSILDRQLQETYGESIRDLDHAGVERGRARIVLRKVEIPPICVRRTVRAVVPTAKERAPLRLERPAAFGDPALEMKTFTIAEQIATTGVLRQIGDAVSIEEAVTSSTAIAAAVRLSSLHGLGLWDVLDELRRIYPEGRVPAPDLPFLSGQIEKQLGQYEVREETVDVALALVKPAGFAREALADGTEVYTAEIVYPKDRESLLLARETLKDRNPADFGFHYDPYAFDSNPEKSFLELVLEELRLDPADIEDVYFTGGLTDPSRTDFFVEYKDEKGKWRRYTPDFVVRRKPAHGGSPGSGRAVIVEIKKEFDRAHPTDGENGRKALAIRRWEELDPDRLRYEILFTSGDTVSVDQTRRALAPLRKDPS